ncbi:hypothetical protein [Amycolatopsis minnesotensis]|uniref:Uncharacterized protein n=1 Tax=Amycolatopsis minnesotensis TaxID=337894 RepID=A0ABN2Q2G4_9PSEU
MEFHLTLTPPGKTAEPLDEPMGEFDLNDYEQVAMYACELLGQTDARFSIGGFGQSDWNFDIMTDFSAVAEALPVFVDFVHSRRYGELDLYPQGVERTLKFFPEKDMVRIECESRTEYWRPDPCVEIMDFDTLDSMLQNLAANFAKSVQIVCPELSSREPLNSWLSWV